MTVFSPAQGPDQLQIIDPVLTNIARAYKPQGFIYDQLVVSYPVQTISGQYPVFDESFFGYGGEDKGAVADRAETPEIDFKYSTEHFHTQDYRRKVTISALERQQAHPALRLEFAKTTRLLTEMALLREQRLATVLRGGDNGGKFTLNSTSPSTKWDDYAANSGAGPDIQGDIHTAALTVYNAVGLNTNTIAMTYPVAYAIALAPQIQNLIKYTVNGLEIIQLGDRMLPDTLFGHKVVIAKGALLNTANQGQAKSLTEVWGDHVRLLYVDPAAAWGMPSTVYGFRGSIHGPVGTESGALATQTPGDGGGFALVDRWVTPDPPVEHIRAWERIDERVVAPDLGFELKHVLT